MRGVDIESFEVSPGSSYARDKYHVYYPIEKTCIDYATCGICYCSSYLLTEVSSKSFEYLGSDYATDGKRVFFRGELIKEADAPSFKVIRGPQFFYFAKDKNTVYRHALPIAEPDPSTFYYDSTDIRNDTIMHTSVVADQRKEWLFIPPETLKHIRKK
jgi:hypothetical protein